MGSRNCEKPVEWRNAERLAGPGPAGERSGVERGNLRRRFDSQARADFADRAIGQAGVQRGGYPRQFALGGDRSPKQTMRHLAV